MRSLTFNFDNFYCGYCSLNIAKVFISTNTQLCLQYIYSLLTVDTATMKPTVKSPIWLWASRYFFLSLA